MWKCLFVGSLALAGCLASASPEQRGDVGPCPSSQTEAVDWEHEVDQLGVSPADAFAAAEGTCRAPLSWNAAFADVGATPVRGQSELEVEVRVEPGSAQLRTFDADRPTSDPQCQPVLQARATVRLRSADGVFDLRDTVEIGFVTGQDLFSLFSRAKLEDHEGRFAVEHDEVELSARFLAGDEARCVGELSLTVSSSRGNESSASQGVIGAWSNTGCGLDEHPIAVDEPYGPGALTLREQITRSFGELEIPAVWDDAGATTLSLQVEVPDDRACAQGMLGSHVSVLVPVRARYGTADGAIALHEAQEAYVRASELPRHQEPFDLQLSDDLDCVERDSELPYTLVGCNQLRRVQLALRLSETAQGLRAPDGLRADEYHRSEDGDPESGREVTRTLALEL